ncbi:MAG: glutamate synthase, partial [Acidobacteriota bacterium]
MNNKVGMLLLESRERLSPPLHKTHKQALEGGCGVVGLACAEKIPGRHIRQALIQMHNRGNSKGGGIAAFGLDPGELGVSREILEEDYMIQVAFLDPEARREVEKEFIFSVLEVHSHYRLPTRSDFRNVSGLELQPPEVWRYFCRVKEEVLSHFILIHGLDTREREQAEDEWIYQNTYKLNKKFYSSLGEKRAFVLSHGRNMLILKIVGYAEQVIEYYQLESLKAHIWIGHQRYPTKGRVWHPGGAHPFMGMNEALVHNGDFANYYSIVEYLRQRNIHPLFLTDTEVSVLLFDLLNR